MSTPKRLQMRRTAGWRMPQNATYVGRSTIWGNPWRVGGKAHGALGPLEAVARYEKALISGELQNRNGKPLMDRLHELKGRDLACWCEPGQPCHAEVLLHYANAES